VNSRVFVLLFATGLSTTAIVSRVLPVVNHDQSTVRASYVPCVTIFVLSHFPCHKEVLFHRSVHLWFAIFVPTLSFTVSPGATNATSPFLILACHVMFTVMILLLDEDPSLYSTYRLPGLSKFTV
jgi:hypothetical protein